MSAAVLMLALCVGQSPSAPNFRSESENRALFVEKLRRDIAKVARAIEVTETLISRSRGAPYLPDIYLRLAELYVEQSRYEFYLVNEERGDGGGGAAVAPTTRLLKQKAIEIYRRILADFPKWSNNDKVTFYIAHELRELGEYEEMIATHQSLVRKYPDSELVLDAYLVLGDHRFDKGDLAGAEGWYRKILAAPPTPTHDIANFKMGWVALNQTQFERAFEYFESAVRTPWSKPGAEGDDRRRLDVKREALVDLAYTYTEVKKPEAALTYFRRLAPSRALYVLALQKLARRYFVKANYPAAATVYREITRLGHDPAQNLDRSSQVYRASVRAKRFRKVAQDVTQLLDATDDYRFDWRVGPDERNSARTDSEVQARDLATRAQRAALQAKDRNLGRSVARAYTRYLRSFPDGERRTQILGNLADTLYGSKRFLEAGDRYEEAARGLDGQAHREALFNACAAFRQALEVGGATMPRFDRLWAQRGLIQNGRLFVERYPENPRVAEIELNIGRSYFEGGEFERAVGVFEEFLDKRPRDKRAETVADLILDAFALRKDYPGLAEKARDLAQRVGSPAFKRRMASTAQAAEERQIGEVILTASVDDASGDSGAKLREYWAQNKSSPVAERTLYTAFVQYKEARDYAQVFDTGNQFIGAYPKSTYLGDVFGTLAAFTSQVGDFEKAAVYLEELEARFPKDASAKRQLARAARIRQLLGDHRAAAKAYFRLLESTRDPEERFAHGAPLLDSLEALDAWNQVEDVAKTIQRSGDPGAIRADLFRGLAAQRSGKTEAASRFFVAAAQRAGRATSPAAAEDAARAAFNLGDLVFQQFRAAGRLESLDAATAAKIEALDQLEATMVDVAGFGVGRWAVAGLHRVGLGYAELAGFLAEAPLPEGLSATESAEYTTAVEAQVDQLEARAEELFNACVDRALALEVMTPEARGCAVRGEAESMPPVRGEAGAPEAADAQLEASLARRPKDLDAIRARVRAFLAEGQFAAAKLMANRGLEIEERDPRLHGFIGAAELGMGRRSEAYAAFKRANELGHPYALANQAALLMDLGAEAAARQLMEDADVDMPPRAVDLHPAAPALRERFR